MDAVITSDLITFGAVMFLKDFFPKAHGCNPSEVPIRFTAENVKDTKEKHFLLLPARGAIDPDEDILFECFGVKVVCNFFNHPELKGVQVDLSQDQKKLVFINTN